MYIASISQPSKSIRALQCLILALLPIFAKANLGITTIASQNGNEVTVDVLVYNFTDIGAIQYTIQWDPAVMQFESLEDFGLPSLDDSNYGLYNNFISSGYLTHVWIDKTAQGLTLPDCSTIYRIKFTSLNGQVSPIGIVNYPTPIEVVQVDDDDELLIIGLEHGLDCSLAGKIEGAVFLDTNGNCTKDEGEASLKDCVVQLQQGDLSYTLPVSEDGKYYFIGQTGEHTLSLILPDQSNQQSCIGQQAVQLAENEQVELDFGVDARGVSGVKGSSESTTQAKVFPNPALAGQAVSLEHKLAVGTPMLLQLFGMNGALEAEWEQPAMPLKMDIALPSSCVSGLYCLKIMDTQNGSTQVVKLAIE